MPPEITPFLFENQHLVRTIERNGDPWFVAPDVCGSLQLTNTTASLQRLDADEKGLSVIETPGGPQELNVISEPGLYRLVSRSNKPVAKRFQRWVFHDVLPTIRKTGRYGAAPGAGSHAKLPVGQALRLVTEVRHCWGPMEARDLYLHLGLETVPSMLAASGGQMSLFSYEARQG